ncbi:probable oxidoreductase [Flavobacteriaceae bacterium 3519-10]|nr:probable oxidoreductase [Flavobacteriaceae bacterium 3519-10]
MNRDGLNQSIWENALFPHHNKEFSPKSFDTIIVGAGITGISLGLELQKSGRDCLILEQKNIGFGTTGGTTAFINNFFDESYDRLISSFGEDKAQTIADNAMKAPEIVRRNVSDYNISCDFAECKFYLFSAEKKQDRQLEKILDAHQRLDVPSRSVSDIPFDIEFRTAIEIDGQAQFHPVKYITALAEAFESLGGVILTDTRVSKDDKKEGLIVIETENGETFTAKNLVWATHIPPGLNRFSTLCAPYRSYALAAKINHAPTAMAQAADLYDAYHYIRYHQSGDENFLIVGGFDHKTGHEDETEKPFDDLVYYTEENFQFEEIVSKWSAQFYVPVDGLPYIGKMPGESNIFVATGYNGNGMTWGTLAAEILSDVIDGKENELADIVAPGRIEVQASAKEFIKENADAVFHLIKDQFTADKKTELEELKPGEGKVIEHDSQKVAAYRQENGELELVTAICPHMGCVVNFNNSEQTWDCPCHGSRFDTKGNLLTGPSLTGLKPLSQ